MSALVQHLQGFLAHWAQAVAGMTAVQLWLCGVLAGLVLALALLLWRRPC